MQWCLQFAFKLSSNGTREIGWRHQSNGNWNVTIIVKTIYMELIILVSLFLGTIEIFYKNILNLAKQEGRKEGKKNANTNFQNKEKLLTCRFNHKVQKFTQGHFPNPTSGNHTHHLSLYFYISTICWCDSGFISPKSTNTTFPQSYRYLSFKTILLENMHRFTPKTTDTWDSMYYKCHSLFLAQYP